MTSLTLIPWPSTEWSEVGRLASKAQLPLSARGRAQADAWAEFMVDQELEVIYCCHEQVALETAAVLAERTSAKRKTVPELAEADAGLWEGLTVDELKHRYPRIFKAWNENPASVCPPQGEDMSDALERLRQPLSRIARKPGAKHAAVILGPVAFGLARCVLEEMDPSAMRPLMRTAPVRYESVDDAWAVTVEFDADVTCRAASASSQRGATAGKASE